MLSKTRYVANEVETARTDVESQLEPLLSELEAVVPRVVQNLADGASDDQLDAFESRLGFSLPDVLRALYGRHFGQREELDGLWEGLDFVTPGETTKCNDRIRERAPGPDALLDAGDVHAVGADRVGHVAGCDQEEHLVVRVVDDAVADRGVGLVLERAVDGSDVEILDVERVVFDKGASGRHIVSHQHGKRGLCLRRVFDIDPQQLAAARIHRRLEKLFGIHLAQALVSLDAQALKTQMSSMLAMMDEVFSEAQNRTGLQLDEVTLSVEINAEGKISIVGNGGSLRNSGGMTLKFTRPQ